MQYIILNQVFVNHTCPLKHTGFSEYGIFVCNIGMINILWNVCHIPFVPSNKQKIKAQYVCKSTKIGIFAYRPYCGNGFMSLGRYMYTKGELCSISTQRYPIIVSAASVSRVLPCAVSTHIA